MTLARRLPRAALVFALLGGAALVVPTIASAQTAPAASDKARAKEAYDRGVEAHKRGDFQRAAREFAEADQLAPSNVALQAALDASVDADDPALGAELLDRARRTEPKGAFAQSVEAAKKKFAGRSGRVSVTCPTGSTCKSTVDGAPMDPKRATWVRTGGHTVVVVIDGDSQTKSVDVRADQIEAVVPTKPIASAPAATPAVAPMPSASPAATSPVATPAAQPSPDGASTANGARDDRTPSEKSSGKKLPTPVFWTAVGITGASTIITVIFMASASSSHSEFVDAGCEAANQPTCASLKDAGESSQTRANIAIGVTAVLGVATVILGAAFTDWSGHPKTAVAPNGVVLRF